MVIINFRKSNNSLWMDYFECIFFSLHCTSIIHFYFKMQALSTAVWSVLKAKRRMLKVNFKVFNCKLLSMVCINLYKVLVVKVSLSSEIVRLCRLWGWESNVLASLLYCHWVQKVQMNSIVVVKVRVPVPTITTLTDRKNIILRHLPKILGQKGKYNN